MAGSSRVVERFIKYVKIHSASKEDVNDRFPSTEEQLLIAAVLRDDLMAMGLKEVTMDRYGYVFATLPGTAPQAPVIGLLAHYDTHPGVSGKNVKPVLHERYDGKDVRLPGAPSQTIEVRDNPELLKFVGDTLITSDGTTLLGADDKAGIAEILEAVDRLREDKSGRPRPTLRIAFTPDEEVGTGTQHFDLRAFGADVAYTCDGSSADEVDNETYCADSAKVVIEGRDVHPGYAQGKMVNAVRIAARFIDLIPAGLCPEYTSGREGYLHPLAIEGNVSQASISFIVRDFSIEGLRAKEDRLRAVAEDLRHEYSHAKIEIVIKESYRNMRFELDRNPKVVEFAMSAVKAAGLTPKLSAIRGGTDGARLSAMGLLTPNICGGGKNFHSKQEWITAGVLDQCTRIIMELVWLWGRETFI